VEFVDLQKQYRLLKHSVDARIHAVLQHGQFIMGPEVQELEGKLEAFTGSQHAVACASGTDALLIALMALGVGLGDEVITSPFTFIATAEVIALLGAKPVFVDIDPQTYNIDPSLIEAAVTHKTKAIMPVSLYGQCADFDAINEIARWHRLAVIEDGAQSFGATYKEHRSCNLSTIGCTSFFPSKPLGCYGDGGMCFTNDQQLSVRMKQIRVHGQDRRYHHSVVGINGRLDTIQAAVLLAKLEVFDAEVDSRRRVGATYTELLNSFVRTPVILPHNTSVYAQYTIEVDHRQAVQEGLKLKGIPTAVHYPTPLHLQPAIRRDAGCGSFPHSERAAQRVLSLPMHAYLADEDLRSIAAVIAQLHSTVVCLKPERTKTRALHVDNRSRSYTDARLP